MEKIILPILRSDLQLIDTGFSEEHKPRWLIYDKVRDQYYEIGWIEFEIFRHWHLNDPDLIVNAIKNNTTLKISHVDVLNFVSFVKANNLINLNSAQDIDDLDNQRNNILQAKQQQGILKYLFYRIKLGNPDQFLDKTIKYLYFLFNKKTLYVFAVLLFIAFYIITTSWNEIIVTFRNQFNAGGLIYFIVAILTVKVVHELGHAYTAKYLKCQVTNMGVAFLLLWPVFYTDTTHSWRLADNKQRLLIDAAGILSELAVAIIATIIWAILPDGIVKNIFFFLAFISWVISVLVNINPCMRFDGYYLFSDFVGIKNLERKAFNLTKSYIGHYLLGQELTNMHYGKHEKTIMIVYAIATWTYRLFLFLGIAIIVYSTLFKLLGIAIACIAIYKLILTPIINTIKQIKGEHGYSIYFKKKRIWLIVIILLFILFYPWQSTIKATGIIESQYYNKFYAPYSGYVSTLNIKQGQVVNKGQIIASLVSPDLVHEKNLLEYDIELIKRKLKSEQNKSEALGYKQTDEEELRSLAAKLAGVNAKLNNMTIKAPYSGEIVEMHKGLVPGEWIEENQQIAAMIDNQSYEIEAFITQRQLIQLKKDSPAKFYLIDNNQFFKAKLIKVDEVNTKKLEKAYVASVFHGDLETRKNQVGEIIPQQTIYKVYLKPIDFNIKINKVEPVRVYIYGKAQPLAVKIYQQFILFLLEHSQF